MFDYYKDEISPNPRSLDANLHAPDKPRWYGVEIEKDAIKKRWQRGVTAAKVSIKIQNECGDWLKELMTWPKTEEFSNQEKVRDCAIKKFGVSKETFKALWKDAKRSEDVHISWQRSGPIQPVEDNSSE